MTYVIYTYKGRSLWCFLFSFQNDLYTLEDVYAEPSPSFWKDKKGTTYTKTVFEVLFFGGSYCIESFPTKEEAEHHALLEIL